MAEKQGGSVGLKAVRRSGESATTQSPKKQCRHCLECEEKIRALETKIAELTKLVMHDQLTGLLNERGLAREFECKSFGLFRGDYSTLSMVYIDLVGFKAVNDNLGHAGGDQMLKIVGTAFTKALRTEDLIARLHGDEFAMLVPDLGPSTVEAVISRMREAVRAIKVPGTELDLKLDFSYGVSVLRCADFRSFEEALRMADERMYASRGPGNYR